jgi:NAD(P)-dependent dehydrogenase (short-subunit alcohol dehydrogenase family)
MRALEGSVAVVAGATRGAGRGIACMLGEAGATVYCTGRSVRGKPSTPGRPETIDETAEMVAARGGIAIPVQVDHTVRDQVRALFDRVASEQGRLDVLVNNVNGDDLADWEQPFWQQLLDRGLLMIERGVHSHLITSHTAVPLMLPRRRGLIVGITDRGIVSFFHGFEKLSVMRIAELLAPELRPHGIAAVAVTPGYLRSEAMLEGFGVDESNWRDAVKKDPYFAGSETPYYVGRAVAALAADPKVMAKSGGVFSSWELAEEYGFSDIDGQQPHWERFLAPTLDRRWAEVVRHVRSEFQAHGLDPATIVEDDRAGLTLRARLSRDGEPTRWLKEEVGHPTVIYGDPKGVASEFYERYAQLR